MNPGSFVWTGTISLGLTSPTSLANSWG